jgi:hypothetical protein
MQVKKRGWTALLKEMSLVHRAIDADPPPVKMPVPAFVPVGIPIFADAGYRPPRDPRNRHRQVPPCLCYWIKPIRIRARSEWTKAKPNRFRFGLRGSELPVLDLIDEVVSRPKTLLHAITCNHQSVKRLARGQWQTAVS